MKHYNHSVDKSRSPGPRSATRGNVRNGMRSSNVDMSEDVSPSKHKTGKSSYIDHLYGLDHDGTSDSQSQSGSSRTASQSPSSKPSFLTMSAGRRRPVSQSASLLTWKGNPWKALCRHVSLVARTINSWLHPRQRTAKSKSTKRGGGGGGWNYFWQCLFLLLLLLAWCSGFIVWNPDLEHQNNKAETQTQEFHRKEVQEMVKQELGLLNKHKVTAAEAEAMVHRILMKEFNTLRSDIEARGKKDDFKQRELEIEIQEMQRRHNKLWTSVKVLKGSVSSQEALWDAVKEDVKSESHVNRARLEEKLAGLHVELHNVGKDQAEVHQRVEMCHNKTVIENTIMAILDQVRMGQLSGDPDQDAFTDWLHSNYISKESLDTNLQELAIDLTSRVMAMTEGLRTKPDRDMSHQQGIDSHGIGEQHVRQMIQEALLRYDADKIALPDFALESMGGSIVQARCSSVYRKAMAVTKLFGFPIWNQFSSPRTVIQPEVHPGQCWASEGFTGFIVIRTAYQVTPTGFTLEHIPKTLAPTGEISSAPKQFTVSGLVDEADYTGQHLGNFTYRDNGSPVQYFPAQVAGEHAVFNLFEFRILSNYGNKTESECLTVLVSDQDPGPDLDPNCCRL